VRDNLVKLYNQLYSQVAVFRQIKQDPGGECKESAVLVARRVIAHEELVLAHHGRKGSKQSRTNALTCDQFKSVLYNYFDSYVEQ
jgi:hypothetical protein